jgi:hypothetical protein
MFPHVFVFGVITPLDLVEPSPFCDEICEWMILDHPPWDEFYVILVDLYFLVIIRTA